MGEGTGRDGSADLVFSFRAKWASPAYVEPMETLLEFLKMIAYVGGALLVLAWIGGGRRQRKASKGSEEDGPVDDMGEIGTAGGLLGGEMEDAFIGRFALRRRRKP